MYHSQPLRRAADTRTRDPLPQRHANDIGSWVRSVIVYIARTYHRMERSATTGDDE